MRVHHHAGATTTFIFNVCGNAVTPDACAETTGGWAGEVINGPAPAFLLSSDDPAEASGGVGGGGSGRGKYGGPLASSCQRLGASATVAVRGRFHTISSR